MLSTRDTVEYIIATSLLFGALFGFLILLTSGVSCSPEKRPVRDEIRQAIRDAVREVATPIAEAAVRAAVQAAFDRLGVPPQPRKED